MAERLHTNRTAARRDMDPDDGHSSWSLRPVEVWVRLAAVPLLLAAVWSHSLLGWAASLGLMVCVVGLALGLPLLQPARTGPTGQSGQSGQSIWSSWAGRVCLAEQLWFSTQREQLPIANQSLPRFLFGFSMSTLVGAVWAAYLNRLDATLLLAAATLSARLAFQIMLAASLRR